MDKEIFIETTRGKIYTKIYECNSDFKYFLFINGLFDSINNSSIDNDTLGKFINERKSNIVFLDFTCGTFKKGKSEGDIKTSNLQTMVEDAREVVDYLLKQRNIESITLVSHSTGCIVAHYLAEFFKDNITDNIWIAPTINNTKSVLTYMFKNSPNFSKIDFSLKEREDFVRSFDNNILGPKDYKGINTLIIPENESDIRKEYALNYKKENNCEYYELKNCDHLLNSAVETKEETINKLAHIISDRELISKIDDKYKNDSPNNDVYIIDDYVIKKIERRNKLIIDNEYLALSKLGIESRLYDDFLIYKKIPGELLDLNKLKFKDIFKSLCGQEAEINSIDPSGLEVFDIKQNIVDDEQVLRKTLGKEKIENINLDEMILFLSKLENGTPIHNDLNRGNILIYDGEVKLIDFAKISLGNYYTEWMTFITEYDIDNKDINLISLKFNLDYEILLKLSILWIIIIINWNNEIYERRRKPFYLENIKRLSKRFEILKSFLKSE